MAASLNSSPGGTEPQGAGKSHKLLSAIGLSLVMLFVFGVVRTVFFKPARPADAEDPATALPAARPLSAAENSTAPSASPTVHASYEDPAYSEQRAKAWLVDHKEQPVPFRTSMPSGDGVQIVQPNGQLRPELVQVGTAGPNGIVRYEPLEDQSVPASASGEHQPAPSPAAGQPVTADGHVALRPPNDSDHLAARHVTQVPDPQL